MAQERLTRTGQIVAELRRAIETGEYPPGSTLPRALDIAEQHGVSKSVAQAAYAELQTEGLVHVVRRRGTVVLSHERSQITRSRLVWRDELGYFFDRTSTPWKLLEHYGICRVPAPLDIAELLEIEPGSDTVLRDRLLGIPAARGRKRDPLQLSATYLPGWLVDELPVLEQAYTGPGGALDRIEESLGGPLTWAEYVAASSGNATQTARLGIPPGSALLQISCVTKLLDGRPVEVTIRTMAGSRFQVGPTPLMRHESATWPPTPATLPKPSTDTPND